MNTLHLPHPHHDAHLERRDALRHRRRNRWLAIAGVAVVALVFYVAGLNWFATRLAADISDSIQPAPALEDSQHRAD